MPKIDFEEGWRFVHKGIKKLQDNLEGLPDTHVTSNDYIMLYTAIFNMCTRNPHDYREELYEKYKQVIPEYITSTVRNIAKLTSCIFTMGLKLIRRMIDFVITIGRLCLDNLKITERNRME
ncbi:unnamed protein product [Lathyrus sativus]|nr:unnamed protein product [Lathyrus sativus]